jgi:hypothetical protein
MLAALASRPGPLDAALDAVRRLRDALTPAVLRDRIPAVVPACRCAGECRCGSLAPALLQRRLELECEFYREVL